MNKQEIFNQVQKSIEEKGLTIVATDSERPWGGFFVIDEDQAQKFADLYYDGMEIGSLKISGKLSPKILVVAPGKRLSWQYHNRRAEIWRIVENQVGVITSDTDTEGDLKTLNSGNYITLKQGERHRLIGLDSYGIVAEIWQHTDGTQPSDEEDIIRVQDDFGR